MKNRIITSMLVFPLFLFFIYKGGNFLTLSLFVISIIGLYEFYNSFKKMEQNPFNWMGYLILLLLFIGVKNNFSTTYYSAIFFLPVSILLIINVFSNTNRLLDIGVTILGVIYIGIAFIHFLLLKRFDNQWLIFIPFVISWGSDTFAYFIGRFLGRRPLIPSVSPKKTKEGALGGVIGAVLLIYGYIYMLAPDFLLIAIFLGVTGSIVSQIGDLVASKIKRICNIKDFGRILPGHGGILDRFDSILLSVPFIYYIIYLYINFIR